MPEPLVIVTGSLGYLGSRLTPYLRERGVRTMGYDLGLFQECLLSPPDDGPTALRDARDLTERDLEGAAAVVHFAGMSNDPFGALSPAAVYDPTRAYAVRLARLCQSMGIRFIFASSCSVYGVGSLDLLTEEAPTQPQTAYSLNKLQIEQDVRDLADRAFSPVFLRFATVFGLSPRMRFDIVVNMLAGMAVATGRVLLNSNGRAWRPNIHIEDACEAITRCLTVPLPAGRPLTVNVGDSRNNCTVLELAEHVCRAVPGCSLEFLSSFTGSSAGAELQALVRDRKIQDGVDSRTYRVSFDRIGQALPGFRCRWTMPEGIADLVQRLQALRLDAAQFTQANFYRLQRLEALFQAGRITPEIRWARDPQPAESVRA